LSRALTDEVRSEFRIFSTRDEDVDRWQQSLDPLGEPDHDLFYGVEYARAYERSQECEVLLACYEEGSDRILMPFALRDLRKLPFIAQTGIECPAYDMTSLYPFGGPVASLGNEQGSLQLHRNFQVSLARYCRQKRIVSQFTAFHPLLENHRGLQGTGLVEVERRKEVVWIDLNKPQASLFREMSTGHRRAVTRARRCGVVVEDHVADAARLAEFTVLYHEMLHRVGASERWNFPDAYFEQCAACLRADNVAVFIARRGVETLASALILCGDRIAYYHLSSGARERARDLRPNHLLIFELALWAKTRGCHRLLLGGGAEPNDGIFRFKAGFSKNRSWLYTSNAVYDEQLYSRLCEARSEWDRVVGNQERSTDFFPAYRG